MNAMNLLNSALIATYEDLSLLAKKSNFWEIFQDIFGVNYKSGMANAIREQWQERDFSKIPRIVVTTTSVLVTVQGGESSGAVTLLTDL